jgi:hypothetical protein
VAVGPSGEFVVAWRSFAQDGSNYGVFAQRYASTGSPAGSEFRVNARTTSSQSAPAIAFDPSGDFVVVFNIGGDGSGNGVFGRRYASAGSPLGSEFRVNAFTTNDQAYAAVAADAFSNFIVVWPSDGQDGSARGIFGQRVCLPLVSVSVGVTGATSVCPGGTGGTATAADSGGGHSTHQWLQRLQGAMTYTPIAGATGTSYQIAGADFSGGAVGTYELACSTTPECGNTTLSNAITVTVANLVDGTPPTVTAPSASTVTQTLCQ